MSASATNPGVQQTSSDARTRAIARVFDATHALEGGGFEVRRPFPTYALDHFDPFLLLDEMGPKNLLPGEARGAPDHPHRGFETVTYLLSGSFEHRDSQGNHGLLHPGDVQWMTAGAGVIHSEMPTAELLAGGGRLHGFQLWVNLPARDKLMAPRYQDVPAARIPEVTSPDEKVHVRVIAGESLGARAVIDTRTPITYLHLTLAPGGTLAQPIPDGHNTFAYVFEGRGRFGDASAAEARDGQAVLFAREGTEVRIENPTGADGPLQVLLLSGQPLGEPVARHGPFVMNTRAELVQAFLDFQAGRFGKIPAQIG